MNIPDYIKLAKRVLHEDAGSEGMMYKLVAKTSIRPVETDLFTITEVEKEDDMNTAIVRFTYPRDYGYALNTIREAFEDIDITSLSLVY